MHRPVLSQTSDPPAQLEPPGPTQQGWPPLPHSAHFPASTEHMVCMAVHVVPQQGSPNAPQLPQLPPEQVAPSASVHAFPSIVHSVPLQHPPSLHRLRSQQASPGAPQPVQTPPLQTSPVTHAVAPVEQHGSPASPHGPASTTTTSSCSGASNVDVSRTPASLDASPPGGPSEKVPSTVPESPVSGGSPPESHEKPASPMDARRGGSTRRTRPRITADPPWPARPQSSRRPACPSCRRPTRAQRRHA